MDDYTREMMDLKTLDTRTLEKKGVLAKIRAELRASVFEAIEEEDKVIENDEGLPPALLVSWNDRAKQLHASPSEVELIQLSSTYWDTFVGARMRGDAADVRGVKGKGLRHIWTNVEEEALLDIVEAEFAKGRLLLFTAKHGVCDTPQTKVDLERDIIPVNENRLPKKLYPKDRRYPRTPRPRHSLAVSNLDVATTGLNFVTNDAPVIIRGINIRELSLIIFASTLWKCVSGRIGEHKQNI